MEIAVYKLNFDCGRQGTLTGLFVANKSHVSLLVSEEIEVYFGEVLGKHSEVFGPIDEKEIIMVSDNPEVIKIIEGFDLSSGLNPFEQPSINFSREGINEIENLTVGEIIEKIIELKNSDQKQ